MSGAGYILTGECDAPVQWEFLFDSDLKEPSVEELENIFKKITDFKLEIERYDINEI